MPPAEVAERLEIAPRPRRGLVIPAAHPLGDHVDPALVPGPPAEHVPHHEIHQRVDAGVPVERMAEQPAAEGRKVKSDEAGREPVAVSRPSGLNGGQRAFRGHARAFRGDGTSETWFAAETGQPPRPPKIRHARSFPEMRRTVKMNRPPRRRDAGRRPTIDAMHRHILGDDEHVTLGGLLRRGASPR